MTKRSEDGAAIKKEEVSFVDRICRLRLVVRNCAKSKNGLGLSTAEPDKSS
tara:strand:+ start:989 stop:1141 length:153 start_codon:yes stop_codon:yes gene_type:complete